MMIDFEQLGLFYLGRRIAGVDAPPDPAAPILLDARDLTTHAVCVGMTGSGKTGLCVALLEEAAIDGVPAIVIDPKGDLGNLLLGFPELRPEDFRPWIDEDDARRKGISPEELAGQISGKWREGLAAWGQDGARIERLRRTVDLALFTPGATFGTPLAVLRSFTAPDASAGPDELRERIAGAASGLLSLLGLDADPLQSREHALLSAILGYAWGEGRGLELADLVREIGQPPFDRVGVLDLETFYPARERTALALRVNNVLASPGFAAWMEGEPLDIGRLLYTREGKPRLAILSIAHLGDAERMFFVCILLNELLAWMRRQPGTTSLRALLYMDEIFGYFPPVANPPSKPLMLTLLKQARAFGLGVVLSTQNPVDLDYKGLANCGTWFLGRLQTERDRERMLDGLMGAAGGGLDRTELSTLLSSLRSRRFLWHSVHQPEPSLFESRWALSYLRGPLSRPQIQALSRPAEGAPPRFEPAPPAAPPVPMRPAGPAQTGPGIRPAVPVEAAECFLDVSALFPDRTADGVLRPFLLGSANVHYAAPRFGLDVWRRLVLFAPLEADLLPNPWDDPRTMILASLPPTQPAPAAGRPFAPLPTPAARPKSYATWSRGLVTHLYQARPLRLWHCPELKLVARPDETERDFRGRVALAAREARDGGVDQIRRKYASKLQTLADRIRRAESRVSVEQAQYQQQQASSTIQIGATIVGALLGGRRRGVGGLAAAARGAARSEKERGDIARAAQEVEALRSQFAALESEVERAVHALQATGTIGDPLVTEMEVAPRKADITVERVGLAWLG